MTSAEYVDFVMSVLSDFKAACRAELPAECEMETRYVLGGQGNDQDWLASLRKSDGNIRKFIILCADLPVGLLGATQAGRNFASSIVFNLELYHSYEMGSDASNTEKEFISDAARVQYAIGKNRALGTPKKAVIERGGLRLGIRPSSVEAIHMGRGEVVINLLDIRYD